MQEVPILPLDQSRDLRELISSTLAMTRAHAGALFGAAALVVVVVDVLTAIVLHRIGGPYRQPTNTAVLVADLAALLVTAPLVNVTVTRLLLDAAAGRRPSARSALERGLDGFAPALGAVVLWIAALAATFMLLPLAIFLLVQLYFAVQAVAAESLNPFAAIARSWELVRGRWLRTCGRLIAVTALFGLLPALVVSSLLDPIARAIDLQAAGVAADVISQSIVIAPLGVAVALIFFDLRATPAPILRRVR